MLEGCVPIGPAAILKFTGNLVQKTSVLASLATASGTVIRLSETLVKVSFYRGAAALFFANDGFTIRMECWLSPQKNSGMLANKVLTI
jgi:hypothetical protein